MTDTLSTGERLRRNRHFPRLCASCQAPMARQQDTCWHCTATWVAEPATPPHTRLRLVGASPVASAVSTADRLERLRAEARA